MPMKLISFLSTFDHQHVGPTAHNSSFDDD